ncbi:MAG TPA: 23S rRNA (adenine(2030)-N(6))-methyltransferase RlmJ [Rhizomicrobium sp.]|jgi:23S rRNA (adenine2030-N6)-methyltransferase|nr:23S rRNA (adenine(2030)-N(6))-methyltransferase RlmJ [Rhizomicrobium sp.]
MNYRHAYHAGNFADVLKHAALVALIAHLRQKEKGFAVVDTHAGRGLYDLGGEETAKTGEAEQGVARIECAANALKNLKIYLDIATADRALYPGSPLIAAKLLRPQDRLVAIEKHPEEFKALASVLKSFPNAQAVEADGYARLPKLLPPAERRGLVLIDPPYERADEFVEAARALIGAYRRFSTGIYTLWYPLKDAPALAASTGEILNAGIRKVLRVEMNVGRKDAASERLSAAGLLIVNPPFGFDEEMKEAGAVLLPQLAQGPGVAFSVHWLAGEA